jgi:hypothetical protein
MKDGLFLSLSLGVSLRAQGQEARLVSLDAWQMKGIYASGRKP